MIAHEVIPMFVKAFTGVFAIVNTAYGIVGYFQPSHTFENSTDGVDLRGNGARYAAYEYSSRNVAMGLGMLIAAVIGSPMAIVMATAIRALVEIQSILINISLRKFNEGFITALVFLAIEAFVIAKMFI